MRRFVAPTLSVASLLACGCVLSLDNHSTDGASDPDGAGSPVSIDASRAEVVSLLDDAGDSSGTGGSTGFDGATGSFDAWADASNVSRADVAIPAGGSRGSGGTSASGGISGSGGAPTTGGTTGTGGATVKDDAGPGQPDSAISDLPIRITCPSLVRPVNGDVVTTSNEVGGVATFTCATGYRPPSPASLTCGPDGEWSGTPPTCNLVDCHAPPPIDNGVVSAAVTTYGSSADYSCNQSYVMSGLSKLVCQADGTWSSPAPTCAIPMARLIVALPGPGTGSVSSTPAGIDCGATCQASFPVGTSITLSASAATNQRFIGWQSVVCQGNGTCTFTLASDTYLDAVFSPPPNIVFVTSTTQNAALGGLGGADSLCMARAQAAGLSGTYKAWLSTSTVNAKDRLSPASGWIRPDGKPVLNRIEDLASNRMFYPARLDEFGSDVGDAPVMTATYETGVRNDETFCTTCLDFTSAVDEIANNKFLCGGQASGTSALFTRWFSGGCSDLQHLYCFGVDRTSIISPDATTGRRAFVTKTRWLSGGGLASADALCQGEAASAGLPGTYKALMATIGASAASRFNTTGAPWIRMDGIPLAPSASAFFSATMLDVTPNMPADASYYFGIETIWSGAATMTTPGTSESTCGNWLESTGTPANFVGVLGNTSVQVFFGSQGTPCAADATRLVCLQE